MNSIDFLSVISDYNASPLSANDTDFKSAYGRVPPPQKINEKSAIKYATKLLEANPSSLTNDNFLAYLVDQVVSEGDIIRYSIGNEYTFEGVTEQRKFTRELLVNNTFEKDKYQKAKAGYSILLQIFNEEKGNYGYIDEASLTGSDVQDNQYNQDVYGDFEIASSIFANEGLGFFIKHLPNTFNGSSITDEELKLRFNFNDNDDNLFCPFTALYKQDKHKILPILNNSRECFYELYRRCGFEISDCFHLSKDKMFDLYINFAKEYKLNLELKVYYFKSYDTDQPITYKKLSEFSSTRKQIRANLSDTFYKFNIARVRGHIFNIHGGNDLRQVNYLNYLNEVNCKYHSLPMKDKDLKKLSREYAMEYNEYIRQRSSDCSQLLKNADSRLDQLYNEPISSISAAVGQDPQQDPTYVFIYDLETINDDSGKFWIYSYFIKCISHKLPNGFRFEYKSDVLRTAKIGNETVKIIDSPFTHMMDYLTTYVPDESKVILFAHNGSNFDNIIVRELMMSSFGFSDIKEICAGENQGILLSIECTYRSYKKVNKDIQSKPTSKFIRVPESAYPPGKSFKTLHLSLRDSKKIINYAVKDLPAAFNVNAYKLPYDYAFYQKFVVDHDRKRITEYHMKNLFKFEIKQDEVSMRYIRSDMENHFTKEFIDEYIPLLNGEYLKKLEDGDFKIDILRYLDRLKSQGKYYDIISYCCLYNKYDVLVVSEAMNKFQLYINSLSSYDKMCDMIRLERPIDNEKLINMLPKDDYIKGADKINIYNYRSLASIVFDICQQYGVYDDIYELKGDLKLFIQSAVVGGRVMVNGPHKHNKIDNYEKVMSYVGLEATPELNKELYDLTINKAIVDFDAVSLYPSAISITAMPAGEPVIKDTSHINNKIEINRLTNHFLNTDKKYFVCVDIRTRKDLKYPLQSELVNKEGVAADGHQQATRNFRNGTFSKIVIGDQTFKDLVKYQDAEILKYYTVVFFPKLSYTFSKLIKSLFNLRLLLKAMGLASQVTVKDLMNCSYGRTILKQSHYKSKYFRYASSTDKSKFTNYLSRNFHLIKPEINCYGTIYKKVSKKDSSVTRGYPHVGAAILETSKSLMHKAFNLLDDQVFYTDTDSMHIYAKDIDKVSSLIGKNMCQFHSDFDPSTKNNSYRAITPSLGIIAIESVFVMKKCYYDELLCIDNKTNRYCIKEHKRVKGVPSSFMNKERYIQLINGEELECDLSEHCNMLTRKNKTGELIKIDKFSRKIKMT